MSAPYPLPPSVYVNTGQLGASSLWNQGPKASLGFLPNKPHAVLYQATAQSIPTGQNVPVALDGSLRDNANGHSTSVNNSLYVCQLAGVYHVTGQVALNSAANANATIQLFLRVNGGTYYAPSAFLLDAHGFGGTATTATELVLWPGNYVELVVYHTDTGPITTATGSYRTSRLSLSWVST